MSNNENDERAPSTTSRRELIKKTAVGAAAAGVVWSAPKVEGLSLRPSYAAAASVPGGTPSTATTTLRFNSFTSPIKFDASAAGQISLAFVTARGTWQNLNVIEVNTINYDGAVGVEITGMDAPNLSLPALTFPVAINSTPITANVIGPGGPPHAWTIRYQCT